jgi:hypothetical protein
MTMFVEKFLCFLGSNEEPTPLPRGSGKKGGGPTQERGKEVSRQRDFFFFSDFSLLLVLKFDLRTLHLLDRCSIVE